MSDVRYPSEPDWVHRNRLEEARQPVKPLPVVPEDRETDVQRRIKVLLESVGGFVLRTNQNRASRVSPGLPDIICLLPRGKGCLFVEAKSRHGKQSDSQILVERKCVEAKVAYVCGGEDEVRHALQIAGLLV